MITVFSLLTRMFGFFFRIFLSRAIGAEALGMYQVALSIFMVLLTVVSSGFTLIISRMTAGFRGSENKKEIGSLVTSSLFVGLAVSVFLCLVILLFKNLFVNLFTDKNCINILIILLPSLIFSSDCVSSSFSPISAPLFFLLLWLSSSQYFFEVSIMSF